MRRSRSCSRCRSRWSVRPRRCSALKVDANLYVQIGLILLIALSAKNAILIVEVARERRIKEGHPIVQAAVEAARARFRPILMTSIAFILSVVPLVIATGAGASARKSIGITVFTGMIASTCLAVLFVPSLFVVIQRFEEWPKARKAKPARARGGGVTRLCARPDSDKPRSNVTIAPKRPAGPQTVKRGRRMDRIWLKNYPAGVPPRSTRRKYASLVALLEESFAKYQATARPSSAWTSRSPMASSTRCRAISPPICRAPG